MEYFRKYLIYIRKLDNTKMKPRFIILMLIIFGVSLIAGFVADIVLPLGFGYNMIRGIIAVITGMSIASYYLVVTDRIKKNKYILDNNYVPFKKRLSYKQRSNLSILIGSFVGVFILLSSKAGLIFTFKTSLAIFLGIILTAFARKDRSEFLKDIYEIPDIRDLEFKKKKSKKDIPEPEVNKEDKQKKQANKNDKWYNRKR